MKKCEIGDHVTIGEKQHGQIVSVGIKQFIVRLDNWSYLTLLHENMGTSITINKNGGVHNEKV